MALEARLRALGYGPERATIARRADTPGGARWAVTLRGPDGVVRHYLSASFAVVLAWLEDLAPPGP